MKHFYFFVAAIFLSGTASPQNADSAKFYYQKAIIEKDAKRYPMASDYFDKAISLDTKYKEAYLENGYVNLAMHKPDAAKGYFTKLYELDPDNKAAIQELATLYYNYNQFKKAAEFATKCTGCDNAGRIIAMSSYKQEDYAAAVKGLLLVIKKDPTDAEAVYTIGRSYLDMELYTKAVPFYTKAIELDATKNTWMNELGLLYYNLNDFKNAKIFFSKALENGYPASDDFNENLGYSCIYSGEFEKGEKLLLDILAKKPGNVDILRDIAEACYQQKMYDKSLEFCQKLMENNPKDARALYQAGLCFQKKGQKDKGQVMCDDAIKMDPSLTSLRRKQDAGTGL